MNEASVGTGLRRIEAVTGRGAESYINGRFALLDEAASELKTLAAEVPARIKILNGNLISCNKAITALQKDLAKYELDQIIANNLKEVSGVKVLSASVSSVPMPVLLQMGDMVKDRLKSVVVVLATVFEEKPHFMATVTSDLVNRGLHSGKLVKRVSEIAGGGGGGKAEMAQAGGKDKTKVAEALAEVNKYVGENVKP
jgi:alanyl-tRNA synthetase